jgi:hypothetical protein
MNCSLDLITKTKLDKEENKKLTMLVTQLWNDELSSEFRQAVNYKELGLIDYPEIIKKPQDLGQVRRNLKNQKYTYVEECLEDL